MGVAAGLPPAIPNPFILLTATAGAAPARIRGRELPSETARNGLPVAPCSLCNTRFSQPSCVLFTPGVPDSMWSCASKCDRVSSGEPAACTIAKCFWSHSGFSGASEGCSPESVQVDDLLPGNVDTWSHVVISPLGVGNNNVEPVGSAALEYHHQPFALGVRLASPKRRSG